MSMIIALTTAGLVASLLSLDPAQDATDLQDLKDLLNRAERLQDAGAWRQALELFERADPDLDTPELADQSVLICSKRAACWHSLGEFEAELEQYEQALAAGQSGSSSCFLKPPMVLRAHRSCGRVGPRRTPTDLGRGRGTCCAGATAVPTGSGVSGGS